MTPHFKRFLLITLLAYSVLLFATPSRAAEMIRTEVPESMICGDRASVTGYIEKHGGTIYVSGHVAGKKEFFVYIMDGGWAIVEQTEDPVFTYCISYNREIEDYETHLLIPKRAADLT